MGRPWREEYVGGIYHVIARGNNKEHIFFEDIDKGYFIKIIKESWQGMGYVLYGFVLMNNHYHLIIQTKDKKLQEIMHHINNKYSKFFNYKYERVGHVFQGRYKAIPVQDERYLIGLLRYVHQNPLKAGLCHNIEEYKWSSYHCYTQGISSYVNTDMILEMLDKNPGQAIRKFKVLMGLQEENDYEEVTVIGEEMYKIMMKSRDAGMPVRKGLDEVLEEVVPGKNFFDLIKSGSRARELTQYKKRYIEAALEYNYTYKEIGENINCTEGAVWKLANK